MSYKVVINSAGRSDTLASKTLPLLDSRNVNLEDVEVWVPNEATRDEYAPVVAGVGRLDIAPHDPLDKRVEVVGIEPVGLGKARNHVIAAHDRGERLLFIDDDLTDVVQVASSKHSDPVLDLDLYFRSMFRAASAAASTLWGIYPVNNPYFGRPRHTYDLRYICGGLFGVEVADRAHEMVVLDDKEDFERSIRHYLADGQVLRDEGVRIGTTGYSGAGGMQMSRTDERVEAAARWLADEFPGLASLNLTKKSGKAEVRLRDRRR